MAFSALNSLHFYAEWELSPLKINNNRGGDLSSCPRYPPDSGKEAHHAAKNAKTKEFLTRDEMLGQIRKARIVITHGGPACYTEVQRCGKFPIVVPRCHKLGEQYDDHQIEIGREYKKRYNTILLVENIEELASYIDRYDELIKDMDMSSLQPHNAEFCERLSKIVDTLLP